MDSRLQSRDDTSFNKRSPVQVLAKLFENAMVGWTNDDTKALVSLWGQANVQKELNRVTRNRIIFERIASWTSWE